jgi:hypothetical protein
MTVEAAGDGTAANAAIVEIPTPHTVLLVDTTDGGYQAIKFPEGHIGDYVEVYFRNNFTGGATSRLRIYDADDNNLAITDEMFAMHVGEMISLRKILSAPHSAPSGYSSRLVGTWIGNKTGAIDNYPPA